MSADLPPADRPPAGPPPGQVAPDGAEQPSRYHWFAILAGVVLGFIAWVIMSFVVIIGTYYGQGTNRTADAVVPWLFLAIIAGAIGLIVWPRSRPLGKGFLLGSAIGMIVAGGLCVPLIWNA